MSDTAERLRLYARQFEDQHAPQTITIAMREAADEIKRLRAALEEIARKPLPHMHAVYKARAALAQPAQMEEKP